ncbi:CoA transferase [Streptacidiphilus monticola]|uniref:CoA transferase n=1 Tax=Streptacidiphilus monticola TaxID=2161674 RepID=A0ABW1FY04_9ACTN
MTSPRDHALGHAWAALGGDPDLTRLVSFHRPTPLLGARLPVRTLATATVAAAALGAVALLATRNGDALNEAVPIDRTAVAMAFLSERQLRIDGAPVPTFAPLSGFWRTADGWVRTHANYPHHRARLLAALALPESAGPELLAAELARREAAAVEQAVYAAGGLAVAVAPPGAHGPLPLVQRTRSDAPSAPVLGRAIRPLEGVRVLDLTRVIAGPVATRTLGLLGADVLRIDPRHRPEEPGAQADTGFGKRSALLDLAAPADRDLLDGLAATADVVVTGYRPRALDRFGLSPEALFSRRPELVVAQLCAWGWDAPEPWRGRRGFDSLVQAGVGIAALEADKPDGPPGVLPAQALDHGTGYLIAAGVLRALTDRQRGLGGALLRYSLAGTAHWLMHGLDPEPAGADEALLRSPGGYLAETDSAFGRLRYVRPPFGTEVWSRPPSLPGADEPRWLPPADDSGVSAGT